MPPFRMIAATGLCATLIASQIVPAPAFAATYPGGFAAVDQDGNLIGGKGVKNATRVFQGIYEVKFPRNVSDCAYFVQHGSPDPEASVLSGMTTVALRSATKARVVRVRIYHPVSASSMDQPFFLQVVC